MEKGNPVSPHDDFTIKSDKGQDLFWENQKKAPKTFANKFSPTNMDLRMFRSYPKLSRPLS